MSSAMVQNQSSSLWIGRSWFWNLEYMCINHKVQIHGRIIGAKVAAKVTTTKSGCPIIIAPIFGKPTHALSQTLQVSRCLPNSFVMRVEDTKCAFLLILFETNTRNGIPSFWVLPCQQLVLLDPSHNCKRLVDIAGELGKDNIRKYWVRGRKWRVERENQTDMMQWDGDAHCRSGLKQVFKPIGGRGASVYTPFSPPSPPSTESRIIHLTPPLVLNSR
jgi:hypothetical protein